MTLKASRMIARLGEAQRPKRDVTSMSLFGLGGPELLVIGAVAAIVFGPSKLPELGKGLGKTVKSFQGAAEVTLTLKSMRNTTPLVRPHVCIYHIGGLQELSHTLCDPVVPLLVAFYATR
jgi:sec-independent protein translocase protein TatA